MVDVVAINVTAVTLPKPGMASSRPAFEEKTWGERETERERERERRERKRVTAKTKKESDI